MLVETRIAHASGSYATSRTSDNKGICDMITDMIQELIGCPGVNIYKRVTLLFCRQWQLSSPMDPPRFRKVLLIKYPNICNRTRLLVLESIITAFFWAISSIVSICSSKAAFRLHARRGSSSWQAGHSARVSVAILLFTRIWSPWRRSCRIHSRTIQEGKDQFQLAFTKCQHY